MQQVVEWFSRVVEIRGMQVDGPLDNRWIRREDGPVASSAIRMQ